VRARFTERFDEAASVLATEVFAQASRLIEEPLWRKSAGFCQKLHALEQAYEGLAHFSVLSAHFSITRALQSAAHTKKETWWRVQVWGPVLDGLLHDISKTDLDRGRASGELSSGSARHKHPDMQLFSVATPSDLDNRVAFLQVEEKPSNAAPTNRFTTGVPPGTYANPQTTN
jgi:hypothetical protein